MFTSRLEEQTAKFQRKQQHFADAKTILETELGVKTQQTETGLYGYRKLFQQALESYLEDKSNLNITLDNKKFKVKEFKIYPGTRRAKKCIAVNCENYIFLVVYDLWDYKYTLVEATYYLEILDYEKKEEEKTMTKIAKEKQHFISAIFSSLEEQLWHLPIWATFITELNRNYRYEEEMELEAVKLLVMSYVGAEMPDTTETSLAHKATLFLKRPFSYSDVVFIMDKQYEEVEKPSISLETLEKRLEEIKEEISLQVLRNQVAELKKAIFVRRK